MITNEFYLGAGIDFELALFKLFLAFDAVAGPRHGFEALGVDFFAAGNALPEGTFAHAAECAFNHLKELALVVALVKEEFLLVGAGCAIGNVLRRICHISVATLDLVSRDVVSKFVLAIFEPFFKSF